MLELLFNFLSLMVFIAGIMAGEVLSNSAFGRPKSLLVSILDLVLVVFLISLIYTYTGFFAQGLLYHLINFCLGALSITTIRSLEWLLRLTGRGE